MVEVEGGDAVVVIVVAVEVCIVYDSEADGCPVNVGRVGNESDANVDTPAPVNLETV